jgi:hypothetical protein
LEEREIIRLNIDRFQWMLETELDRPAEPMIEGVMREFESRLSAIQNGKCAPKSTGAIPQRPSSHFNANPIINLGSFLPPQIGQALKATSKAIQDFALSVRLAKWRLISTAPCNQELELRIVEDGKTITLEFPCLKTNAGAWINVDLGAEMKCQAVEWRIWERNKSPQPHHSQVEFSGRQAIVASRSEPTRSQAKTGLE